MTSNSEVKRIGIMGGTFDPLHYGHLVAAEMARNEFRLEKVIFIPTGNPPHKMGREITNPEARFQMVKLATEDNLSFGVSRIEIERIGHSYTVDTLRELHQLYPEHEIYFITGSDAFREIFTWKDFESALELCHFIGASRPGFDAEEFMQDLQAAHPEFFTRMHLLEVPALAISSTDIRSRVRKNQPIRYLLPEAVRLYIERESLYQNIL
jgi:nicotinate-nucleotide adenylyltransferase